MKKTEYVAALRELANYVESHDIPEEIAGWWGGTQEVFSTPNLFINARNTIDFGNLCRSLGSFKKERTESTTGAVVELPTGVKITVSTDRENVCKRVVIGTRKVEAIPERVEIIEAEPEREVEIVEWECPESFMALGKDDEGK